SDKLVLTSVTPASSAPVLQTPKATSSTLYFDSLTVNAGNGEKTVTQFCRKLAAERPLKDIRDEYNYPKKKGIKDECSRLLEASTMKSRRGFAIQRLMNAMRQAHADGWFIVFDTLTLADDRLEAF